MISHAVDQVSTFAKDIDVLILLICGLVGFWFFVAEGVLFFLVFKYRAKEGGKAAYIDGTDPKHTRFISWPHRLILLCDVVIVVAAVRVWVEVKQTMPTPDQTVRVVSQQWSWSFQHPGPDNKLDTADDIKTLDELHVVAGQTVQFELVSQDVIHSFSVPVFRLKQDAIPGRVIKGWFKTTQTGSYDIQCAEICGIGHGAMVGTIVIEQPERYAEWVAGHAPVAALATPAPK
ncbi:MAG: cytochrome c oxidase subunit II [Deltaproteobacteria bacterium]|nr:cytochrome c oxidase subunit II [Deltaproteobacteria bacterium]